MTDRIWLGSYPPGVPADIDVAQYGSIVALMDDSFAKYGPKVAYSFMGRDITYAQTPDVGITNQHGAPLWRSASAAMSRIDRMIRAARPDCRRSQPRRAA